MLLELAVAAHRHSIITFNVRDFVRAEKFPRWTPKTGQLHTGKETW